MENIWLKDEYSGKVNKCHNCGGDGIVMRQRYQGNWYRTYVYCNDCKKLTDLIVRFEKNASKRNLLEDSNWVVDEWNKGNIADWEDTETYFELFGNSYEE